nr:restriction endonuclease subunit S [uncultured Marinifilum sp.]
MESNWQTVQLQDVVTKLGDGLHGTPKYTEDGEYHFINGNNLVDGKIVLNKNTKRVDRSEFEKYKKELTNRTVFVSINGTIGNVAFYNSEKVILGKSACYFNVNENTDKVFIRYIVSSPYFMHYLETFATGTTIKNVSLKSMREFPFKLPPLPEQKAIAHILSSLDEKIELNRQMNQTLEQMAQALFKSWFVDFDPVIDNALAEGNPIPEELQAKADNRKVLGKNIKILPEEIQKLFPNDFEYSEEFEKWVPLGWRVGQIKDIGKVVTGKTPPSKSPKHFGNEYPFVTPTDFKNYFKFTFEADRYISKEGYFANKVRVLPENSVVVTCIGSDMGKVIINTKECLTNQQINSVIPDFQTITTEYLYQFFKSIYDTLRKLAFGGSTMPILNKSDFENINILIPNINLLTKTSHYFTDINNKIIDNLYQNRELTKLRDTLLPKLISGEVRVTDVEKMIK